MSPSVDNHATPELDNAARLPAQNRRSLVLVLLVQALNSFNDNFVKMLLVAFAIALRETEPTTIGAHIEVYLGIIFPIPYVLLAPLAGYLSDRFSKQRVIIAMQVLQVVIFAWFAWALWLHQANVSLVLSLVGFFLLATQAAFFSPAKMGIMKELCGSRRLGSVSGWLQMTMFIGILSGIGAAGPCFKAMNHPPDPWRTALVLVLIVTVASVFQVLGSLLVSRTPEHKEVTFRRSVLWEHFVNLKLVFVHRQITLAAIGIAYFWFASNAISTILVALSRETHPDDSGAALQMPSLLAGMLGIGVVGGSLLASVLSRKRIELGLVPVACFGMTLGVLWAALTPLGSSMIYASMLLIGGAGGLFMTPLYAYVQDLARPEQRARILSSVNLLDSLSAVVANAAFVGGLTFLGVASRTQLLILTIPSLAVTIFLRRLASENKAINAQPPQP
jgi:acyl-[acyl-carrier-protein]-phospholipid O-acyltransferase/long-chain-fatty-acid--[acyl-carrier-protein] ligase